MTESRRPSDLGRRLLVTALAVTALLVLQALPVPLQRREPLLGSLVTAWALGASPILAAFLLIEVLALVLPAWRPLRQERSPGRTLLARRSARLALLLAAIQGLGLAKALESLSFGLSEPLTAAPWWVFRLTAVLTWVAATALVLWLAARVQRDGLGSGLSVVILVGALPQLGALDWASFLPLGPGQATVSPEALLRERTMPVLLSAALALAALVVAFRTRYGGAGGGPWHFLPTTGLVPIAIGLWLIRMQSLVLGVDPGRAFAVVATIAAAVACGWLFHRPERVRQAWHAQGPIAPALYRAHAWSVALLLLLYGLTQINYAYLDLALDATLLGWGAAIVLDLAGEWRFRRRHGELAGVARLHRMHEVAAAVDRIERAAIPVLARGRRHRALLQFFGPFVPVDLLVPMEHVERARERAAPPGPEHLFE